MKSLIFNFVIFILIINNVTAQTHNITIHTNQRVASLEMAPPEYSLWITNDGFSNITKRQALIQDIYQKFDDKFDFIFLILNEPDRPLNLNYLGKLAGTSNAIKGIGKPIFNIAGQYGSAGRLKSIMALTALHYLRGGPSLHELMHNWGNYLIASKDWNGTVENNAIPHWGFLGGSNLGQLGGFKQSTLKANIGDNPNKYSVGVFGGNANGGNSVPFTDLELYLMGMIPITDVASFDVFSGITQTAFVAPNYEFIASKRVTYDSLKILADAGGPRNPSSVSSQKNFRLLVVVITPAPLTATEWASIDDQAEKFSRTSSDSTFSYNFWEATRGIGTIETGNLLNAVKSKTLASLIIFNAELIKTGVVNLNWSITPEINNDYFTVERSDNGLDWIKRKTIKSKGNSSATVNYQDEENIFFGIFYYRLKQTDLNGNSSYSKVIMIENKEVGITVYPNPANKEVTLSGDIEKLHIYLTDLHGRRINIKPSLQQYKAVFNISNLAAGIYFINYNSASISGSKKVIVY